MLWIAGFVVGILAGAIWYRRTRSQAQVPLQSPADIPVLHQSKLNRLEIANRDFGPTRGKPCYQGVHGVDTINNFEPDEDSLLFVWDDSDCDSDTPMVTVQPDPDHDGQLQVWMDDEIVAQVSGQENILSAAEISLIPLSSATALGYTRP